MTLLVDSKVARLYHIVAINERTGRKTYLTSYPDTHEHCCTIMSKQSDATKLACRIYLEEIVNK